ncbi:MAG: hypothetical protein KKF50_01240 [Nanoarchaeota archaeon]|nr:hypothetical protein [Nanoarchaeota archaeon]
MEDIFDHTILCSKCNKKMKPSLLTRNGFNLRAIKCEDCGKSLIHPEDKNEYEEFMRLKQKEYNVKMRMVGNSYAVSIPREIVDFMQDQENVMSNMVRLCFEEAGKISLDFDSNNEEHKSRVVSSEEVRVVKNGKPVYHVRKVSDSANPKNNQTRIFKAKKEEEEEY